MKAGLFTTRITRRELLRAAARAGLAFPAASLAGGILSCGGGSSGSTSPSPPVTDDEFLGQMVRAAFQFFWEQGSATTGLIKDRAFAAGGNDNRPVASIASMGFGLTALCIGHKRGYGDATQIQSRVSTALNFVLNQLTNFNGFFYHFVDMNTGMRTWSSEVSSIDTSILLCGVLTCRSIFRTRRFRAWRPRFTNG